jgi:hypothetical protein
MWRILTASLGAGRVSGHRMIGVISGGDRRPGPQEVSVPGARCAARPPGTAHVPCTVAGAGIGWFVRRHLTACGVMLAGQARWAGASMQACHEAIGDSAGLVQQWRVTQLTRLGIPGPLAQAQAGRVGWHQIARLARRGCAAALAVRIVR